MHLEAKKLINKIIRNNPDYRFLKKKTRIETEAVMTVLCKTVDELINENAYLKEKLGEYALNPK